MKSFGKVDIVCIGFMVVIVLMASGFWAVTAGWVMVGSSLVFMGWVWWIVVGIVVASLIVIGFTLRKPNPQ